MVRAFFRGMTTITSFRDLLVWQKSMELAVRCYRTARTRHSTPHYVQHLWTAHASGAELETQLEIGARVEIIPIDQADLLIRDAQEIGRMLNGLIRSLEPKQ